MTLPEFLYYIGYSLDKRFKLKRQKRLPYKVVSIGNITVGGTGKTPATIAIAEEAKKRGLSPIILTRGYRGKEKGPCLVNAECGMRNAELSELRTPNSELYGDEPVLMAERLKDVPIVKCADRYEGGMFFLQNYELSAMSHEPIFILDDGFQHWRLHRDIDIVLIDGMNPFGNKRMLPTGPLREPLEALKRADIFVVTKTPPPPPLDKGGTGGVLRELRAINPDAPVFFSHYETRRLRDAQGAEYPIELLKDKKIYAFCGIANPESFKETLLPLCRHLSELKAYRDHHFYTEADLQDIARQAAALNTGFLITTEKDMVKLKGLTVPENLLCIKIDFCADKDFFNEIFRNIT